MSGCSCADPIVFGHDACFTTAAGAPRPVRTVHDWCRCGTCPCYCHQRRQENTLQLGILQVSRVLPATKELEAVR